MNNGIVPGGFDYDITSTPGPVDFIYLKSASGQVIQASGPVTSSSTPLKVSSVDGNGNGAAISCYP